MTAPSDLIRRDAALDALARVGILPDDFAMEAIRAIPADPVAEAAGKLAEAYIAPHEMDGSDMQTLRTAGILYRRVVAARDAGEKPKPAKVPPAEPNNDRVWFTPAQAEFILADGDSIHTFSNPSGGLLLGADWDRSALVELIERAKCEASGATARSTKHGLCIWNGTAPLFVATDEARLVAVLAEKERAR